MLPASPLPSLAYGLTALLLKGMLGQEGVFSSDRIPEFPPLRVALIEDIPAIGPLISGHTLLVYLAYLSTPVVAFVLYRTPWGLRVLVVGEAEDAAAAAGIGVASIKFQTMLLSGVFCGPRKAAYLSLGYVSLFAKQMRLTSAASLRSPRSSSPTAIPTVPQRWPFFSERRRRFRCACRR